MKLAEWPSTTSVIKRFGLIAEDYSSPDAMRRGRLAHAACHIIGRHQGQGDANLGDGWLARHPECHGYIDAYRKFLREHRVWVIETERECRNEIYRFVSHPDQIVVLDEIEGEVDLELKTGSMPKWCQLQTAGQVLAIGQPKMKRFGLQLKVDGTYRLFSHEDFRDLDRFIAMVETYWTVQEFRTPLEELIA
jgi:hypothetical protein